MMNRETEIRYPKYTLIKRAAEPIEGVQREGCYDLIVEDDDGRTVLEDAAGSRQQAVRLLNLFEENCVGSVEARYVMEDMLADSDFIE